MYQSSRKGIVCALIALFGASTAPGAVVITADTDNRAGNISAQVNPNEPVEFSYQVDPGSEFQDINVDETVGDGNILFVKATAAIKSQSSFVGYNSHTGQITGLTARSSTSASVSKVGLIGTANAIANDRLDMGFQVAGLAAGAKIFMELKGSASNGVVKLFGPGNQVLATHTEEPFHEFIAITANGSYRLLAETKLSVTQTASGATSESASIAVDLAPAVKPPEIIAAVSRRAHNAAGFFDINLPLTDPAVGPTATEPRENGTLPQVIITFDQPIEAEDGSVECGDEVQVLNATCDDVGIKGGNSLVLTTHFGTNVCVSVFVTGIRAAAAGPPMLGLNTVFAVAQPGNVNTDTNVNILDLQAIKNQLAKPVGAANFKTDVNCSGSVNILDLQVTKNNLNHFASCVPIP